MGRKNYGSSHETFTVSAKRFDLSPFLSRYRDHKTVFGISANRFYPLSTENDPTEAYWNLKKNVMLYDVPEKPLEISGRDATKLLEKIFTRTIRDLKINRARYAIACDYNGGIFMDGVLIRLGKNKFWYIHANGDFETWLLAHTKGLHVNIRDPKSWAIQIQGPNSLKVLQKLFKSELANLKYYYFMNYRDLIISNTGYTGCGGYEIYCKNEDVVGLWNNIFEAGSDFDIKPIGLAARDTLRLEMGFCLYGNELNDEISPIEAGLSWITKTNKIFTSSSLFKRQKEVGVNKKLIGFEMLEKAIPRNGYTIFSIDKKKIGIVTSGTMSPSLKKGIGLGYVKSHFSNLNDKIFIEIRGNMKQALIVKTPFK